MDRAQGTYTFADQAAFSNEVLVDSPIFLLQLVELLLIESE